MSAQTVRRHLLLVENYLFEAQNYKTMFNGILFDRPDLEAEINNEIKDAKRVFKRNDRIVWYLRFAVLHHAKENHLNSVWDLNFEKLKKKGLSDQDINSSINLASIPNFEHFLSLPIPEIQNFIFEYQSASQVIDYFEYLETKWKKRQSQVIDHGQQDDLRYITFPDGMFWQILDRPSCEQEGKAMGHCGNTAAARYGDRILSLRQEIDMNGKKMVRPSLTFILHKDGELGEMKGRGNQKPSRKYHPHIIALLKSPLVKEIVGGGYKPENNFSIGDLTKEEQYDLIKEKPGILGEPFYTKGKFFAYETYTSGEAVDDETHIFYFTKNGVFVGSLVFESEYFDGIHIKNIDISDDDEIHQDLKDFIRFLIEEGNDEFSEIPSEINPFIDDLKEIQDKIYSWDTRDASELAEMLSEMETIFTKVPENYRDFDGGNIRSHGSINPFDLMRDGDVLAYDQNGNFVSFDGWKYESLEDQIEYRGDDDQQVAFYMWENNIPATEENISKVLISNFQYDEEDVENDDTDVDYDRVIELLDEVLTEFGPYEPH